MSERKVRNLFVQPIESRVELTLAEPESPMMVNPNPPSLTRPIFGDWILCKKKLPEMHEANNMLKRSGVNKVSDICITTIYDGKDYYVDTSCRLRDGEWWSDKIATLVSINKKCEVIAWMPLPKPYKAGSEVKADE